MNAPEPEEETVELLQRWHGGDGHALAHLLDRHLPALREHVSAKLDLELKRLRRDHDSMDLVQDAAVRVLEYLPRFVPKDGRQFQALLRRIVLNQLLNEIRSPKHHRREASLERHADSLLDLRASPHTSAIPERALMSAERQRDERAWARMALEFLEDEQDRRLVLLAAVEERAWEEIGAELELSPDAARMRYKRLLPRIANRVRMLKEGRVDELLAGNRA